MIQRNIFLCYLYNVVHYDEMVVELHEVESADKGNKGVVYAVLAESGVDQSAEMVALSEV